MSNDQGSTSNRPEISNESNKKVPSASIAKFPVKPSRRPSTALLTKPSIGDLDTKYNSKSLLSDATTAINLESIGNANIISPTEESTTDGRLQVSRSNKYPASENSLFSSSNGYNTEEDEESPKLNDSQYENEEEELQEILHHLRHEEPHKGTSSKLHHDMSVLDLSILTNSKYEMESQEDFIDKYMSISKSSDSELFHNKLKHFFILSVAGKPIYSMNGSDDIIIGYMGFITTIVSTFQESFNEEVKAIRYGDLKIVLMNKNPLIFVAITKINYEMMISSTDEEEDKILIKQLKTLHNYLLAILSNNTILKNFHNRMNYDLRKILTPLDFHNFDSLCMKLTYGFSSEEASDDMSGFDFFVSELLDSSLQSVKITNTTRTKLNSILLSCKKIKPNEKTHGNISSSLFFADKTTSTENESFLGDDLLFALLTTTPGKIMSIMKPKNHTLSNEDLKILFAMVTSTSTSIAGTESTEDLWIPLCMPNFNPNGFLYVFVKKIDLSEYVLVDGRHVPSQPILIILISGNKNSFFQLQELSRHIIDKLTSSESFRNTLSTELLASSRLSILHDIKVPVIKHFIYRSKRYNQCIMSDVRHFGNEIESSKHSTVLQLVYFYSSLHNIKSTAIKPFSNTDNLSNKDRNKKLTFTKWNIAGNTIVGFMLSDSSYEFYCLCRGLPSSQELISHSLKIIKWCEKYNKRLFVGNGVTF